MESGASAAGSSAPPWLIPPEQAVATASRFIATTIESARAKGVVVGLSGGIDSSVATALATRALGPGQVLGVFMPHATSNPASLADARAVASHLGIPTEKVDITPMVEAWRSTEPRADRIRLGNVMARLRMLVLYDISARDGTLVLGTGNRSESLLGYTTLHGDNACALNPIGQLYKTEIRHLATHLELPAAVILKPPSADLWVGQSDEDELGFTYAEADPILHHLVDEGLAERQVAALGHPLELVQRLHERMRRMYFKRQLPPVAMFPGRPDPAQGAERGGP